MKDYRALEQFELFDSGWNAHQRHVDLHCSEDECPLVKRRDVFPCLIILFSNTSCTCHIHSSRLLAVTASTSWSFGSLCFLCLHSSDVLPSELLAYQCDAEHVQIALTLLVWQERSTSLASSDHSFESSIHPLFLCYEDVDCCIHTLLACWKRSLCLHIQTAAHPLTQHHRGFLGQQLLSGLEWVDISPSKRDACRSSCAS